MKKRLTNVQKLAITIAVCMVMIGGSFAGVLFTIGESTDKLLKDNKSLQAEYDDLLTYVQNRSKYVIDSKKYAAGAKELVDKYPNNAKITTLTYEFERWWDGVDDKYENKYDLTTPSISFSKDANEVATIYIGEDTYVWNKSTLSMSYKVEYDNFKDFMNDLYDMQYGLCPTAITISTDREDDKNFIVGSVNFDINFISGSENEALTEPVIDDVTGVESVFFGGEAKRKNPDISDGSNESTNTSDNRRNNSNASNNTADNAANNSTINVNQQIQQNAANSNNAGADTDPAQNPNLAN